MHSQWFFSTEAFADNSATVTYQAHIEETGWQGTVKNDQVAGTTGKRLRIEAFKINLQNDSGKTGTLQYRAHVENIGWQNWVGAGQVAGTTGRSLRVEAFQIHLTGQLAQYYYVQYRAHVENIGWQDWTSNGGTAGTVGQGLRVEAFQINIVPKNWWKVVSTSTYSYNKSGYQFYALRQIGRADGLYSSPWMTSADATVENHDAQGYNGTIVYADKEAVVKDPAGGNHAVVHINLNGKWSWIDKGGLSWDTNATATTTDDHYPMYQGNSLNANNQIVYKADGTAYSDLIDKAANDWNAKLGRIVFVKAGSDLSKVNLKISDSQDGLNGNVAITWYTVGKMELNTSYFGKSFTNAQVNQGIIEHEMGHALGIDHTGRDGQTWSWSNPQDAMWSSSAPNNVQRLTTADINAVKLGINLGLASNTAYPYVNKASDGDDFVAVTTVSK
ncbi:MAG: hypothetical protein LBT37_02440 [Lactobacillaceae bacterium]|nr:hypothetical protein [Lactobacillaceae bacterium]